MRRYLEVSWCLLDVTSNMGVSGPVPAFQRQSGLLDPANPYDAQLIGSRAGYGQPNPAELLTLTPGAARLDPVGMLRRIPGSGLR